MKSYLQDNTILSRSCCFYRYSTHNQHSPLHEQYWVHFLQIKNDYMYYQTNNIHIYNVFWFPFVLFLLAAIVLSDLFRYSNFLWYIHHCLQFYPDIIVLVSLSLIIGITKYQLWEELDLTVSFLVLLCPVCCSLI